MKNYKAIVKMEGTENYYIDNVIYKDRLDYFNKNKETSVWVLVALYDFENNMIVSFKE